MKKLAIWDNNIGVEGATAIVNAAPAQMRTLCGDMFEETQLLPGWEGALQGKLMEFDMDNDGAFNDVELGNFLLAMQGLEAGSVPEDQLADHVQAFKNELAQDTKNLDQNGNVSIMGLMSISSKLATVGLGEDWVQEKPWGIIAIADALSVSSSMNSLK